MCVCVCVCVRCDSNVGELNIYSCCWTGVCCERVWCRLSIIKFCNMSFDQMTWIYTYIYIYICVCVCGSKRRCLYIYEL